jgi:hypothetical protein
MPSTPFAFVTSMVAVHAPTETPENGIAALPLFVTHPPAGARKRTADASTAIPYPACAAAWVMAAPLCTATAYDPRRKLAKRATLHAMLLPLPVAVA